jgi:hypothetical protein
MPAPRLGNQWPTAGERQARCIWQYATPVDDGSGGRGEPVWTDFASWWAKVLTVPAVQNEVDAVILYQAEGPYRSDVVTHFTGGKSLRLVANGLTLKVFQVENPLLRNRTLIAHCANAVNTQ